MTGFLERKGVESPRVVAEKLMSHVFECERLRLYMEADRPALPPELAELRSLVARAGRHEPLQFLFGKETFFLREFAVAPVTLIPRPSTETLVEFILHTFKTRDRQHPWRLADIGTGSGCIAVSLALGLPSAVIVATDVDEAVLDLARENAARHGVSERLEFRLGSLLEPLGDDLFDAIASNPPYIPDDEWEQVALNVKDYEPARALRGGPDGLRFVGPLVEHAAGRLDEDGFLAVEIAASTAEAVQARLRPETWRSHRILKDHEGLERVLIAERA